MDRFRILKKSTLHYGGCVWVTKSYPHWGWLGLVFKLHERLSCLQKHCFVRLVLENCYYANARMAIVLILLLCRLSRGYFRPFPHWTKGTGSILFWPCFSLLHFSVHFLSHHTRDSLRELNDLVDQGHWKHHRSKFIDTLHSVWKILWVENFVTTGWTTKIMKIGTPPEITHYTVFSC